MSESITRMREEAEENEDGDLIYTYDAQGPEGTTQTVDLNVTDLLTPGERRVGSVEHLVIEAKLYDEGEGGGNPAKPADDKTAKQAIEQIQSLGLEPTWRLVENPGEFP